MSALRSVVCTSMFVSLLACDPSSPCDPGSYEEHGACYPERMAVADTGPTGDMDAGDEGAGGDPYAGFGDACAVAADCPPTLTCGAPMLALCTQVNCMADPAICPPDWTCFDTTGLSPDPSVTSVCLML